MATEVTSGFHAGASFMPTNGIAARAYIETQIIHLRARGVKNPRGRLLDEKQSRHNKKRGQR